MSLDVPSVTSADLYNVKMTFLTNYHICEPPPTTTIHHDHDAGEHRREDVGMTWVMYLPVIWLNISREVQYCYGIWGATPVDPRQI